MPEPRTLNPSAVSSLPSPDLRSSGFALDLQWPKMGIAADYHFSLRDVFFDTTPTYPSR
jgi:hypothetical protein